MDIKDIKDIIEKKRFFLLSLSVLILLAFQYYNLLIVIDNLEKTIDQFVDKQDQLIEKQHQLIARQNKDATNQFKLAISIFLIGSAYLLQLIQNFK